MPTRSGRTPYGAEWKPQEPSVNIVPFVLMFVGVAVFFLISMQGTWVGQLMRRGPEQVDPMDKLTYADARNIIDNELNKNLAAVGAKNSRLTWHAPGAAPDPNNQTDPRLVDGPIELTVTTTLPTPDLRKQVVDPIKPYFEKAKLFSLEMSDTKSHAHWTYNMTPGATPIEPDAGLDH